MNVPASTPPKPRVAKCSTWQLRLNYAIQMDDTTWASCESLIRALMQKVLYSSTTDESFGLAFDKLLRDLESNGQSQIVEPILQAFGHVGPKNWFVTLAI